jgi:hypothetical protein
VTEAGGPPGPPAGVPTGSAVSTRPAAPPPPPFRGPPPPPSFVPRVHAHAAAPAPLPPPTAETLAIPLGPSRLVGVALDLLTRPDSGLRGASFYIGLILLVTLGPAIALFGVAAVVGLPGFSTGEPVSGSDGVGAFLVGQSPAWFLWLMLALIPAFLGFVAAGVEARALATAVIGGRAEGRPLRLRESIAVTRARFWSVLAAQMLVGLMALIVEFILSTALSVRSTDPLGFVISTLVGIVVGLPFIYSTAGIVLGEAGALEAMRRSVGLARARLQLAVVVTLFSVLAGLVVQFGLGLAADTVSRVVSGAGLADNFPPALVIPLAAALVFAYGTLVFLTEAIAAAPAVHGFVALTHYTGGLELGRRRPLSERHAWEPWFTPGLAAMTTLGLATLVFGVLALPLG